jgi:hypothetical protein
MRITHDPQVEITSEELTKALKRPSDFGYFGENEDGMFSTWALGPVIVHRESGLVDQSNAKALLKFLEEDPTLADEWRITDSSHWAVGWVHHLSYRAVDEQGKPTRIARIIKAWFDYLRDVYPIADDDLHSEMVCDADWKWIGEDGPRVARRLGFKLPEEWQDKVMTWWDAHRSSALEDRDDQGASPDEEDYRLAFEALGFERDEEE